MPIYCTYKSGGEILWQVQSTFGRTIKLEDEKAYREAVKKINSNLQVLVSEMAKVTEEFTKNDKFTSAFILEIKF